MRVSTIVLALFLGAFLAEQRAEAQFQRMFLPKGKFTVAPKGVKTYRSYCLDLDKKEPKYGTAYHFSAGDIMVRIRGDEKWLDLNKALEMKLVEVRGIGKINDLDIVNLSDKELDFDLKGGIVVPKGDLKAYQPIPATKELLKLFGDESPKDPFKLQDRAWDYIETFRSDRREEAIRKLIAGDETLDAHRRNYPDSNVIALSKDRKEVLLKGPRKGTFDVLGEGGKGSSSFDIFQTPRKKGEDPRYAWFRDFDRTFRETVSTRSTQETRFVYCDSLGGENVNLQVGRDSVLIPRRQLLRFLDDGTIPDRFRNAFESGATYVLTRNTLEREGARQDGPVRDYLSTSELVVRLQEAFPKSRFYLDDEFDIALANLRRKLPTLNGNLQVVEPDAIDVLGRNILSSIRDQLTANGLNVVRPGLITAGNIIVLSGERGIDFDDMLRDMFDRGDFRDRIVVMFSCGEGGEEDLNHSFLTSSTRPKDRPQGILFYRERISPLAVQEVLLEMSRQMGDAQDVRNLIERAIENVLRRDDLLIPRRDIQRLRNVIHQISQSTSVLSATLA